MMKIMRALAFAGATILAASAQAQQFPSGYVQGNAGASAAVPRAISPTAWLDRWCSATEDAYPIRGSSSWACAVLASGVADFLSTSSSANLATAITDETGSGALVFATSPTLVTPALGTPSSVTLTNATGLPVSTGISGLDSGVADWLATASSANLATAVTDETGSGALVFGTSPSLTTPNLGTPSAATLTNATGLPVSTGISGLGTGISTWLATPSSANLISALTDESGTGALVFGTSPTIATPDINGGTADALTSLGIRSTGAAFDLVMATAEVFTASRTLSWTLNDANRAISLKGDVVLSGNFATSGDDAVTLTTSGATNVTLPTTGTLATLAATETLTNKSLDGDDNTFNDIALSSLADQATGTVVANVTGGSAAPTAATPSSVLDLIGSTRGSILYRGASGWAALSPGSSGQVFTTAGAGADPSWQDSTGSGGGIGNTDRRNILLDRIAFSKLAGEPQRRINEWQTGFKAATDADRGIDTCTNCDTTNAASDGYIAPTSAQSVISGATGTAIGNMTGAGGLTACFDEETNQAASVGCLKSPSVSGYNNTIGKFWGAATTKTISRFIIYASNNASALGAGGTTCKLQGSTDNFSSSVVDLYTSGTILATASSTADVTSGITTSTAYRYHRINCNGNGANDIQLAEIVFYEGMGVNDLTLTTVAQTADATVNNGRVLVTYDEVDDVDLNTDLTAEVACDSGDDWTAMTLAAAGTGQDGHLVAETADTTCDTSGTQFRVRIKTLNNTNLKLYGASASVH